MNQSDAYYRALLAYRRVVAGQRECQRDRAAFMSADGRGEITVTRAICTVDEEWIHAIETGLIHIEKAIKEERQFIYSNGEVIPIEKVKHVSKDSVEHLARHADLITRVQEGEDLIPDKLYTVERLSDYAVYENRFLYMLLCYLRDFVTIRYQKILELTNRYNGCMRVDREVVSFGRTVSVHLDMQDVRRDDPYLREHNPAKELIDRMDLILKTITAFLSTPLMESAGKAAMLKPPITKTNVLKMDNNFKGAVRLYDFIIAYDKPGYTVEKKESKLSPFREDLADELAQAGAIISFLTYEYGLGLKAELKERYNEEEKRRRLEELKKKTEQLEAIGRKLKASGMTAEEYILSLEKHLRALSAETNKLESMRAEIELLKNSEKEKEARITELLSELEAVRDEMAEQQRRHEEEIYELKDAHEREMEECRLKHEAELEALKEAHRLELESQKAAYEERIREDNERHAAELESVNAEKEAAISAMKESVAAAEETAHAATAALGEKQAEYDKLYESSLVSEALVKALRAERGINNGDFTDKVSFDRLEEEYRAFTRFYNASWTEAKRKIRRNILSLENLKRKKDDSE